MLYGDDDVRQRSYVLCGDGDAREDGEAMTEVKAGRDQACLW